MCWVESIEFAVGLLQWDGTVPDGVSRSTKVQKYQRNPPHLSIPMDTLLHTAPHFPPRTFCLSLSPSRQVMSCHCARRYCALLCSFIRIVHLFDCKRHRIMPFPEILSHLNDTHLLSTSLLFLEQFSQVCKHFVHRS